MRKKRSKVVGSAHHIPANELELDVVDKGDSVYCRIVREYTLWGLEITDNYLYAISPLRKFDGSSRPNSKTQTKLRYS